MSKQSKTAGKTAARNKSRIERNIINALERAKEIVIRREETPAGMERKRMDMLSTFDRLHELSQLYRGGTSFTKDDIIYTDNADNATITITGQAFANLKEITEITNKWANDNYTPTDILRDFCFPSTILNLYKRSDETWKNSYEQTLAGEVASQMINGHELWQLFEAAGFYTSF